MFCQDPQILATAIGEQGQQIFGQSQDQHFLLKRKLAPHQRADRGAGKSAAKPDRKPPGLGIVQGPGIAQPANMPFSANSRRKSCQIS